MNGGNAKRSGPLLRDREADPLIRLLIVDDSPVARAVLARMIGAQPGFEVAALAGSAAEALEALRRVHVDIILLDLEMPGPGGLEALPAILAAGAGARVLIVSSLCERGAEVTVRALALGAADTLPKPGTGAFGGRFAEVLAQKLRRIGRAAPAPVLRSAPTKLGDAFTLRSMPDAPIDCVAIGASTGGLHAIIAFLQAMPATIAAPILVTQHLPALFVPIFARQLASASGRTAAVAEEGQPIVAERIYVAPGDAHLLLERSRRGVAARLCRLPAASRCLPSVDPMLASAAETYGAAAVGVVLSGMGRDGLAGSRSIVERGGAMLAQDRTTSVVWGMPRAVAEAGLSSAVLPPDELARCIAARLGSPRC